MLGCGLFSLLFVCLFGMCVCECGGRYVSRRSECCVDPSLWGPGVDIGNPL